MAPSRPLAYLLGIAVAALLLPAREALAVARSCGANAVDNTTNVLCASPSGPCSGTSVTMSENLEVTTGGCTFDLGGRALVIQKTFQMIGSGFISVLNAGNITITSTGKLKARGDFVLLNGFIIQGGTIALSSSGAIMDSGVIDVSGDSAGAIQFTAVGDVTLANGSSIVGTGDTVADEGERYADGGTLDVRSTAGSITIDATISLPGNNQATGGAVTLIAARDVTLMQAIDATGGGSDGGEVELDAGDDILVTKGIDVSSRVGGGDGGSITFSAGLDGLGGDVPGGTLTVNDTSLKLQGSATDTFGGDGGLLDAAAQGLVRFTGAALAIRADAATTFNGDGGEIDISSGDNDFLRITPLDGNIELGGLISLTSGGAGGSGGILDLSAGRDVILTASVDASGKQSGGDLGGDAGGAIQLAGVLTAVATDTVGGGGSIDFAAGLASVATLTVTANILAAGGDTNGSGDFIALAGCGLSVGPGVKIDGHAGTSTAGVQGGSDIDLISRTPMQLKTGDQFLAFPVGRISTVHPPGQDPVIAGGVIFNPGRIDRPQTAGGYPNCPVCGDGIHQGGEGCDDGNLSGGDGCAADCTVEPGYACVGEPSVCGPACGDGRVIAPEQCDDGNLVAGDGCGPSCTVDVGWTCTGAPSLCAQTCGDGTVTAGEQCDDGNLVSGDGCDANCRFTGCGNGIVTAGEACDDGNTSNGDCCSALCQFEAPGSACGSDGNVCTNDVCNALGTCVHTNNSAPCTDDGNVCTSDVCSAGACTHTPNTAPCSDGNACTQTDTCQAGTCVGASPVVCTALDQCHIVGTCVPATGVCSTPAKSNGAACNDGDACTRTDSCQVGVCTGANPVVCTALDQCHLAGTCAPATGVCSTPSKPDGSGCSDGSACTRTDTCQAGVCSGGNPVVCTALDQCHAAGTCAPATGVCSNIVLNGVSCNDANVCTRQDVCVNGSCIGDTRICNDGILQSSCGELCDDGNLVNGDGCDTNCTPTACGNGIVTAGEACDDGDVAGGDGCSASCTIEAGWTCTGSPSRCTEVCGDGIQTPGEQCDDGNVVSRDGCSSSCRLELCAALPASGCRLPIESQKALLSFKEKSTNDKDVFSWKWARGAATPKSAFGQPNFSTDYAVCLYDEQAGTPHLKLSVDAPHAGICKGRACWRELSTGFKYNNPRAFPDGKLKVLLKEGLANGDAKIVVKGKGSVLLAPSLPLDKNPRVRLQLRNSAGACWEASYGTSIVNLPTEFKAKAD